MSPFTNEDDARTDFVKKCLEKCNKINLEINIILIHIFKVQLSYLFRDLFKKKKN